MSVASDKLKKYTDWKYFRRSEFACKCGCGYDAIHPVLVHKLDLIREELGIPLVVESGCRCEDHNKAEGGRPLSQHKFGRAADIRCWDGLARYKLVDAFFRYQMRGIGIAKSFVHCDIGLHEPARGIFRPVVWTY